MDSFDSGIKKPLWKIVTVQDNSLLSAAYRVFSEEEKYVAHVFVSKIEKDKSLSLALENIMMRKKYYLSGQICDVKTENLRDIIDQFLFAIYQLRCTYSSTKKGADR